MLFVPVLDGLDDGLACPALGFARVLLRASYAAVTRHPDALAAIDTTSTTLSLVLA